MFRRVQETDYHTSEQEQSEIESLGWNVNFPFPQGDAFMAPVEAEIDSIQEQLTRRANNGN
jgi:hypothetical protein